MSECAEWCGRPEWIRNTKAECCPNCRGYRLESSWCHVCNGKGIVFIDPNTRHEAEK